MFWKIECNTLASWCINKFLYEYEISLQCQCIITWWECGGSHFTHYTTYVTPNYKTMFLTKWESHTYQYMLEPILLSAIQTIPSMWLSSHSLWCETRHWSRSHESNWLCTHCPKEVVWVIYFDTMLQLLLVKFLKIKSH